MLIAFVIWTAVALVFLLIGISSWKSEKAVGFFSNVKPPEIKNVKKYNKAVAKIWFGFAAAMEIIGIPLLFIEQNSPIAILIAFAVVALIIAIMIIYFRVEAKYRV